MKAILFGGDGYIGRRLKQLTQQFDEVVLTDHCQPCPSDVEYVDVRSSIPTSLAGARPPDWIVLLAAVHREPGHRPAVVPAVVAGRPVRLGQHALVGQEPDGADRHARAAGELPDGQQGFLGHVIDPGVSSG